MEQCDCGDSANDADDSTNDTDGYRSTENYTAENLSRSWSLEDFEELDRLEKEALENKPTVKVLCDVDDQLIDEELLAPSIRLDDNDALSPSYIKDLFVFAAGFDDKQYIKGKNEAMELSYDESLECLELLLTPENKNCSQENTQEMLTFDSLPDTIEMLSEKQVSIIHTPENTQEMATFNSLPNTVEMLSGQISIAEIKTCPDNIEMSSVLQSTGTSTEEMATINSLPNTVEMSSRQIYTVINTQEMLTLKSQNTIITEEKMSISSPDTQDIEMKIVNNKSEEEILKLTPQSVDMISPNPQDQEMKTISSSSQEEKMSQDKTSQEMSTQKSTSSSEMDSSSENNSKKNLLMDSTTQSGSKTTVNLIEEEDNEFTSWSTIISSSNDIIIPLQYENDIDFFTDIETVYSDNQFKDEKCHIENVDTVKIPSQSALNSLQDPFQDDSFTTCQVDSFATREPSKDLGDISSDITERDVPLGYCQIEDKPIATSTQKYEKPVLNISLEMFNDEQMDITLVLPILIHDTISEQSMMEIEAERVRSPSDIFASSQIEEEETNKSNIQDSNNISRESQHISEINSSEEIPNKNNNDTSRTNLEESENWIELLKNVITAEKEEEKMNWEESLNMLNKRIVDANFDTYSKELLLILNDSDYNMEYENSQLNKRIAEESNENIINSTKSSQSKNEIESTQDVMFTSVTQNDLNTQEKVLDIQPDTTQNLPAGNQSSDINKLQLQLFSQIFNDKDSTPGNASKTGTFSSSTPTNKLLQRKTKKVISADSSIELQCKSCRKSYFKIYHYNKHLKVCGLNIKCDLCTTTWANKKLFSEHYKKIHNKFYSILTCDICEKNYLSQSSLKIHKFNVHKICKVCSRCFPSKKNLNDHIKICQNNTIIKPHTCKCKENNISNYNLEDINTNNDNIIEYSNNDDEETSKKLIQLEKERNKKIYKFIKIKNTKFYNCDECDFVSKSIKCLSAHEKIHNNKSFPCKLCDKIFARNYALKTHMLTVHMQISKLTVNKNSIKSPPLKYKIIVSKNNKKELFYCNYCKFYDPSYYILNKHHTFNHKLYKCLCCNRLFSRKNSLHLHIAIKHLNFDNNIEFDINDIVKFNSDKNNTNKVIDNKNQEKEITVLNNVKTDYNRCKICFMKFNTKNLIDSHYQMKHDIIINEV